MLQTWLVMTEVESTLDLLSRCQLCRLRLHTFYDSRDQIRSQRLHMWFEKLEDFWRDTQIEWKQNSSQIGQKPE